MQRYFRVSLCVLLLPAMFAAACARGCSDERDEQTEGPASEPGVDEITQAEHDRFDDFPAYGQTLPVPDTMRISRLRGQRDGLTFLSADNPDAALEDVISQIDHLLDRLGWEVTDSGALDSGGEGARQWRASHPDVPAINLTAEPLSGTSGAQVQVEWALGEHTEAP